jgi:hypothetical protein
MLITHSKEPTRNRIPYKPSTSTRTSTFTSMITAIDGINVVVVVVVLVNVNVDVDSLYNK